MSNGIVNPKGRRNLNESSRSLVRPFFGLTDLQLGLIKPEIEKGPYVKPFSMVESRDQIMEIQEEIRRLRFRVRKKKSSILLMLRDKFDFTKFESEQTYFSAVTHNRVRIKKNGIQKKRKPPKKKAKKR